MRLSTRILVRAIALKARIDMLPPAHICAEVASVAAGCVTTWTSVVEQYQKDWAVPGIRGWEPEGQVEARDKTEARRRVRKYLERVLWPAAHVHEASWWAAQEQKYPPRGSVVADVVGSECASWHNLRAWVQLRLQDCFSIPGVDLKSMCPLCCAEGGATLAHLMEECRGAAEIKRQTESRLCCGPLSAQSITSCESMQEVEAAIVVSGALLSAVHKAVRASEEATHEGHASSNDTG